MKACHGFTRVSALFLALFLLLSNNHALSQIRRYKFERFGTGQGLSNPKVFCMLQDREGFLWFGTLDGLNRYDGNVFTVYRHHPGDSRSIQDNVIKALYEDRRGDFWVGTYEGYLFRFDRITGHFYRFSFDSTRPAVGTEVAALVEDAGSNLWVGTTGAGVWVIDSARISTLQYLHSSRNSSSLASNFVYALHVGDQSEVWLGTGNGLDMFDTESKTFVHFRNDPRDSSSLPHNIIRSIVPDAKGTLLIGTWGGGLAAMKSPGVFARYLGSASSPSMNVFGGITDHWNRSWTGTSNGVVVLDPDCSVQLHFVNVPGDYESLSHNSINALMRDQSGVIWIGTDEGLCKFVPRSTTFGHQMVTDRLEYQSITALLKDSRGDLWIGSQEYGLFCYGKDGHVDRFLSRSSDGLGGTRNNEVVSIHEDISKRIWVGTFGGGVNKFDARSKTLKRFLYHPSPRLPEWSNAVLCIADAPGGDLWLGTWDIGLVRLEDTTGRCTYYPHRVKQPTTLSNNCVTSLLVDRAGRLWLGTEGGGLNLFHPDSGTFSHFRYSPNDFSSLSSDRVYSLAEATDGKMWVGTAAGLNKFDFGTRRFTRIKGLESNYIKAIRIDRSQNVWVSTVGKGVICYSESSGMLRSFDVHDGLQDNTFDAASFLDDQGMVYFGGKRGYNAFVPESILVSSFNPPIVIVGFQIFDKPSNELLNESAERSLRLSYAENFFSFEFAILDFVAPSRTTLAYKLEGVDRDWVYAGQRRYTSYTNVPAGEYVLRYKGTNSDGVWMNNERILPVIISPPFWETYWFRALIGISVAGFLYALYRFRIAQLLKMERMRVRIASDLHDEIGSSLASVGLLVDSVKRRLPDPLQAEKHDLESARHFAVRTSQALRDIVWIINPEHDGEDVIVRMKQVAAQLLPDIRYSFNISEGAGLVVKSPEFRQHLLLVFKEILHNIVKHSQATKVEVSCEWRDGTFGLTVSDNGRGFDEGVIVKGMGLNSMQHRAASLHGSVKVHSEAGNGTSVYLEAKIPG